MLIVCVIGEQMFLLQDNKFVQVEKVEGCNAEGNRYELQFKEEKFFCDAHVSHGRGLMYIHSPKNKLGGVYGIGTGGTVVYVVSAEVIKTAAFGQVKGLQTSVQLAKQVFEKIENASQKLLQTLPAAQRELLGEEFLRLPRTPFSEILPCDKVFL